MSKPFILTISILMAVLTLKASPAFRMKKVVQQPDGTMLTVVKMGNENFSFYLTTDNVPVIKGQSGTFYYAKMNVVGNLVAEKEMAHDKDMRTPSEATYATDLKSDFQKCLTQTAGKQRYGVGILSEASVNSLGSQHIPIILVQFDDVKFVTANDTYSFTDDAAFFEKHFNQENYQDEGGGSVRDYFISQSDSQFLPTFDIIGPVTLSNTMAYYGANNSSGSDVRVVQMMQESISKALQSGADFSKYATSSNGIPFVGIIYAGYGEQASDVNDAIWAKYESKLYYNSGNYTFRSALCTNEIADYTGKGAKPDGIGTFCHEFSHALGLPDFYNTAGLANVFGLDYWDIMDYGQFWNSCKSPVGYSAYERNFMKWMHIDTLQTIKQLVEISPLSSQNAQHRAYKILNANDATGNEYYILENRQTSPWYSKAFGSGMLIYHVDYDVDDWTSNGVNNDPNHQRMTILPADGKLTAYNEATATDYRGDFFPGNNHVTALTDDTSPCDTAYTGKYMHRELNDIQQLSDGSVSFYYMAEGQVEKPENFLLTQKSDKQISVQWTPITNIPASYVLLLLQNGQTISRDTVSASSFTFQNLLGATSYNIQLKAISPNYIDSDVQEIDISTYPTNIRSIFESNKSTTFEVYSLNGRYLGKIDDTSLKTYLDRYGVGIYLIKYQGNWQKVMVK